MAKVPKQSAQRKQGPKAARSTGTSRPKDPRTGHAGRDPNGVATPEPAVLLNLASTALPTLERPFIVEHFPTTQQIAAEYYVRHDELLRQRRRAERVLKGVRKEWTQRALKSGQVISLNVTYRTKFREVVAPLQYVIQVDVARKHHQDLIAELDLLSIPRIWDGVPVKVREARAIGGPQAKAMAAELVARLIHLNDIGGGAPIGSDALPNSFGTLGMCVRDAANNLCGITNAHVAGTNRGGDVYQPPANPNIAQDQIGEVIGDPAFHNLCDAALVDGSRLAFPRRFIEGIPDLLDSNGNPFRPESFRFLSSRKLDPDSFLKHKDVIKVGAATGVTHGNIKDTCVFSPPVAHIPPNAFNSIFSNVISIDNSIDPRFLMEGDSGSFAVYIATENNTSFPVVVGLNIGTLEGGEESYAFPFGRVIKELELEIRNEQLWMPPGE